MTRSVVKALHLRETIVAFFYICAVMSKMLVSEALSSLSMFYQGCLPFCVYFGSLRFPIQN